MAQYVEGNVRPEIILTSPLKRAKKTADLLQEVIGCELVEVDDLMEFNNGVLAGMSRKEASIKYPFPDGGRPIHVPIKDGESELDLRFRAERVFNKIIVDYKQYKRVAIVSHGGLISNFLKGVLNLPNNSKTIFATGDTGLHLIDIREDNSIIKFLNKQDHLLIF
ncbi:histidine phosphatase family protein [Ureibacillus sp. GCM10028918]|uniref:histidine phosphatase family protein n=1 Tax=Ureibacillus sp. GCM10028918 TaxID=3273429 RepID=UPI00361D29F5